MKNKIKNFLDKKNKRKLICLTSYNKSISCILDKYCDLILVGDSLANVLYGMKTTHNLKLETMINHAKSVKLGTKNSLLVVDMPKNSYKNPNQAVKNAKLIIKKTGCDAIKIENNLYNLNIVKALKKSKIDVMGHIGYTPQFKKKFKAEGKNRKEQIKLLKQAQNIEKAGAFSIVLECISKKTANKITQSVKIPTIGIGSSNVCDGQILVTDDMLGISGFYPKFVKKFVNLEKIIENSIKKYKKEIISKKFPNNSYSF
ncbi:MAG: 3-methyl-2-oxobutanoate hydroxymethyltransferase [Candidatus Pelagibacter sp.]|nr:3-methyl-2-oxobutanoate hydroxymethyltransferase [Candidatus Pelagibacter sp.]OUW68463.1 MAG: 3-methyl-2-oxobutanoate hydroxymethyltransferase [Candidatus Pelagibacter sp. TMED202]|tara:strand:- start:4290 stop:5063 length:774 start_codon:yes stop_codon:yes gene_type:complete